MYQSSEKKRSMEFSSTSNEGDISSDGGEDPEHELQYTYPPGNSPMTAGPEDIRRSEDVTSPHIKNPDDLSLRDHRVSDEHEGRFCYYSLPFFGQLPAHTDFAHPTAVQASTGQVPLSSDSTSAYSNPPESTDLNLDAEENPTSEHAVLSTVENKLVPGNDSSNGSTAFIHDQPEIFSPNSFVEPQLAMLTANSLKDLPPSIQQDGSNILKTPLGNDSIIVVAREDFPVHKYVWAVAILVVLLFSRKRKPVRCCCCDSHHLGHRMRAIGLDRGPLVPSNSTFWNQFCERMHSLYNILKEYRSEQNAVDNELGETSHQILESLRIRSEQLDSPRPPTAKWRGNHQLSID
jgi:hypothetical protein